MATKILTNVKVREAREEDIPAMASLIAPYVEQGTVLGRTLDEFDELLPSFFVAELDGRVVGCVVLEIYSPKLAEIRSLAVADDLRGAGVGRMLVNACLERARERKILEVMAITSSDEFFIKCGFDYTLPGAKRALFIQTRE
ncbi:MAG: GNAT family N-acetyltransferase [Aggregatilineales bacterium]